ncbi:redoxin domain-containing protein [archaeon]|nr:MAG: redoxin domain-containing protein [archaeon]
MTQTFFILSLVRAKSAAAYFAWSQPLGVAACGFEHLEDNLVLLPTQASEDAFLCHSTARSCVYCVCLVTKQGILEHLCSKAKWVVFVWYLLGSTYICPTEIIAFSDRSPEFEKINIQVIDASCDSLFTHLAE